MSALASYALDVAYSLTNCFCCFPQSPNLKINGRSFKILRLLGEGGFSYVYLVQDTQDPSKLYALKKIRCPFGAESVSLALREVEAYSLFAPHPNIIHAIDHAVVNDSSSRSSGIGNSGSGEAKTVYILLPYFSRGNLQDVINANLVNRTKMGERRLMVLMLGVCRGLRAMHRYRKGETGGVSDARKVKGQADRADADMRGQGQEQGAWDPEHEDDEEVEANSSRRRTDKTNGDTEHEPLMEDEITQSQEGVKTGEIRAYAHRDIKPGNIMIASDGRTPIVMDLGSLAPSPTPVTSRSQALAVQDTAAEHCTMPYRAPELFDVRVGSTIDGKVDIWSLGCTIYACLIGASPFEKRSEETGGSLTMCVLGGDWRFPDEGVKRRNTGRQGQEQETGGGERVLNDGVKDVIRACLRVEPSERPDVEGLMKMLEDVIAELPREDDDVDG